MNELAHQIITAEYGYVAQTAFQANEDRARAWQYFFVTFATLIAALLSTQVEGIDRRQLYLTFVVIFGLLAALGLITILQLVRLRQAWLESVRAMNQIKARLLADDPALAGYFRWTDATVPPAFKARSFGFLQAVSVALLSGLALGAAVTFGALAGGGGAVPWALSLAVGGVTAGLLLWLGYVVPLRRVGPVMPGPEAVEEAWKQRRDEFIAPIRHFRTSSAPGDPDEVMRELLEAQQAVRGRPSHEDRS